MIQTAVVTGLLPDGKAEITVDRKTACGGDCSSCGGGCAAGSTITVTAENPVSAALGDTVRVESRSGQIIAIAVLVYLSPMLAMILGYVIALLAGAGDVACVLTSLGCLVLGIGALVLSQRKRKARVAFVITAVC